MSLSAIASYVKTTRERNGGDIAPLQKIPVTMKDLTFVSAVWRPNTLLRTEGQIQSFAAAHCLLSGLRSGALESESRLSRCEFLWTNSDRIRPPLVFFSEDLCTAFVRRATKKSKNEDDDGDTLFDGMKIADVEVYRIIGAP